MGGISVVSRMTDSHPRVRLAGIARGVHIAAMGVWLGVMVVTGVAAAIAFPTTRALDPHLPGYAAYPGEHWSITAGHTMNKLFGVCDWAGFVLGCGALLAVVAAMVLMKRRGTGPMAVLRAAATAIALVLVCGSLFVMRPTMQRDLGEFWEAARNGQVEQAEAAKLRFDAMHPKASMLLTTQAGLVLIGLLLGVGDLKLAAPAVLIPASRPAPVNEA